MPDFQPHTLDLAARRQQAQGLKALDSSSTSARRCRTARAPMIDDAFIAAILEDPDTDAPRLIYADWLEERGDPRGEFIRVQCELARMPPDDHHRLEMAEREKQLIESNADSWLGPSLQNLGTWQFKRGFLSEIGVSASE